MSEIKRDEIGEYVDAPVSPVEIEVRAYVDAYQDWHNGNEFRYLVQMLAVIDDLRAKPARLKSAKPDEEETPP